MLPAKLTSVRNDVWLLAVGLLYCVPTAVCVAEPYLPASDDEVLETLPREFLASRNEIAQLRMQLAQDPRNSRVAAETAQRYVSMGQQLADPRYYGYAQAAIDPWWDQDRPPVEILRVRAKLKERDHLYAAAVEDLQKLVDVEPEDAQAWIELINIYRVQGAYEQAQQAFDQLAAFADSETSQIAEIPLLAAAGKPEEAYDKLADLLPQARRQWPDALRWIYANQAEIARALGRDHDAEVHFLAGLSENPGDYYLLRGYADLLLDHDRDAEVLALLRDYTADTGALLRAAIAARQGGQDALADSYKSQLRQRFVETRLRGGEPHGRYEARYYLELQDDPDQALAIAIENWAKQKEQRDTRNLLEAALAANQSDAARPALEFLDRYEIQDRLLWDLRRRLELR